MQEFWPTCKPYSWCTNQQTRSCLLTALLSLSCCCSKIAVFVLAFACGASVMWTAYIICQPPTVCMHASLPPPNSRCDSHRNEVHTHTTMAFVAEQREHHACTSQDEARCTHMHGAGIVQPPLACCNSCRGHNCKTLDSRHTEHSSTHPPATTS